MRKRSTIFFETFLNLYMQKGVEINPQKRQLMDYAAFDVEKYMIKKLCSCCI